MERSPPIGETQELKVSNQLSPRKNLSPTAAKLALGALRAAIQPLQRHPRPRTQTRQFPTPGKSPAKGERVFAISDSFGILGGIVRNSLS